MASKERTQIILSAKDETAKAFGSADRRAKGLGGSLGDMAKSAGLVTAAFGAIGIAAVAALAQATNAAIDAADNIAKTADAIGISTDALQEYRVVAERAGIETTAMDKAMSGFIVRLGELRAGQGTLTTFLERTNAAFADQLKAANTTDEAFTLYLKKLASITNASDRAAFAAAAFGSRLGPKMALLVKDGSEALDVARQRVRDLGQVLEERLLRDAERARDAIDDLTKTLSTTFSAVLLENAEEIKNSSIALLNWSIQALRAFGVLSEPRIEKIRLLDQRIAVLTLSLQKNQIDLKKWTDRGKETGAQVDIFKTAIADLTQQIDTHRAALDELETQQKAFDERQRARIEALKSEGAAGIGKPFDDEALRAKEEVAAAAGAEIAERRAQELQDTRDHQEALRNLEADILFERSEATFAFLDRQIALENFAADQKEQAERRKAAAARIGMATLANLASVGEALGRRGFEVAKAAAIAETLINTYKSATAVFASAVANIPYPAGPIVGAISAAAAVVAGLANVKRIKAQKFGGGGGGGGSPYGGTAPTGGGGGGPPVQNVPAQAQQQQLPPPRNIDITIQSDSGQVSLEWIEDKFLPTLNEALGDGATLNVQTE